MFSQLAVVVLLALFGTSSGAIAALAVTAVTTAVSVINDITTLMTGPSGVVGLFSSDDSTEVFQNKVLQKLDEIDQVSRKIDSIGNQITDLFTTIKDGTERILASVEFNRAKEIVANFKKNIDYVNNVYKNRFAVIKNKLNNYSPESVNTHIPAFFYDCSLDRSLSELYSDITSSLKSQSSIFTAMSKYYDIQNGYRFRCEDISPMDDLHIFFGLVMATFCRGYTIIILIQRYLHMTSEPDDAQLYLDQQNITLRNFIDTIEGIHRYAKIDFNSIGSYYRGSYACDPSEWKEGQNFIRVKNYMSFQITDQDWIDKYPTAEELARSKEYDCYGYAAYKGIPGTTAGTSSYVCVQPFDPELPNPYSIEYSELRNPQARIWESRTCVSGFAEYTDRNCAVDNNSDRDLSIRKMSLKPQECDTSKNEVVTDARFHEKDNIIHIKLRCGVFRDGKVESETLRWTEDNKSFAAKDYIVLSSKLKSINLDNNVVGRGELLTGAQLKVVDKHFISLEVKGIKIFNYYNGSRFGERKTYPAPNSKKPRTNIDITNRVRPPKQMHQTYEMSKAGENYINLTLSKYSSEHNNRAIVPYFTMTSFKPRHSLLPLSGLGIAYMGWGNYTGFLTLKHLSPIYVDFIDIAATVSTLQQTII